MRRISNNGINFEDKRKLVKSEDFDDDVQEVPESCQSFTLNDRNGERRRHKKEIKESPTYDLAENSKN